MKKIINLILVGLLFLIAIPSEAQIATQLFKSTQDSIIESDTVSKTVYLKAEPFQIYSIQLHSEEDAGDAEFTVRVYTSLYDGDYTLADSVIFTGVTADTTITFTDTDGVYARYIKVELISTATDQRSLLTGWIRTWAKP